MRKLIDLKLKRLSLIYSFKFFNGIILPTNGKIDHKMTKTAPY